MFVAVDFDGTIVEHRYPEIGNAVPGAIRWLKKWKEAGAKLILWTMRCDNEERATLTEAVDYCRDHGIEFYGVNCNPSQSSWTTSPKAYSHVYVDDAAFGCPLRTSGSGRNVVDWDAVGPNVLTLIEAK